MEGQTHNQVAKQINAETDRQTDKCTGRQTDRRTDEQTVRQISVLTEGWLDIEKNRQMDLSELTEYSVDITVLFFCTGKNSSTLEE